MIRPIRFSAFAVLIVLAGCMELAAQQPDRSGTFVLHKFARAIGEETYSIAPNGDSYTLTSHFTFTDRGTTVPLETTFTARTDGMKPISYVAKGKSSRLSEMDDALTVEGERISMTREGKKSAATPKSPWFVADGYSPVAMQEQMMRWWLASGKPEEFTTYPNSAKVRIAPAETLTIEGTAMHGYTVGGLIWGVESLWVDDAGNLTGLVSTDESLIILKQCGSRMKRAWGDSLRRQ